MAEGKDLNPGRSFLLQRFSKPPPSATRPPLRRGHEIMRTKRVVLKIHGVCSLFPSGDSAGCQIRKCMTHPIHTSHFLKAANLAKSVINRLHFGLVHGLFDQQRAVAKKLGKNKKSATVDQIASMRIFMAVAETGALNGAARQMEISPSAVSKHIAALENKLGAQLLTRTTRQVALTEVGASYLQSCRMIIAELDKANSEASTASGSVQGVLHVGAPIGFAHRHVAPHLPIFLEKYPHLSVELQSAESDTDMIEAGFDVCIRVSPA